jgi:hypothetical protein
MILREIKISHLVLVNRRWSDEQYLWIVGLDGWMSNDACEALPVNFNGSVLLYLHVWETGAVRAEEAELSVSEVYRICIVSD